MDVVDDPDVYKRQAAKENREHILTDAEKEIDKHIESLRAFSDIMVKQQEKIAQLEKENVAVSYTHLDVYKRQI